MVLANILKKMLLGRAFKTEKGRIRLFGDMDWILIPAKSIAINFQHIAKKNGPKYLYKMGYEAGKDAAEEMIKHMRIKLKGGWSSQKAVVALLEFIGFGKVDFIKVDMKKNGHHHAIIHVQENPVIEHAKKLFGKKSMVCNWFMGVYSAHAQMELGLKNAKLKERKCYCKGSSFCEWETKW